LKYIACKCINYCKLDSHIFLPAQVEPALSRWILTPNRKPEQIQ